MRWSTGRVSGAVSCLEFPQEVKDPPPDIPSRVSSQAWKLGDELHLKKKELLGVRTGRRNN